MERFAAKVKDFNVSKLNRSTRGSPSSKENAVPESTTTRLEGVIRHSNEKSIASPQTFKTSLRD